MVLILVSLVFLILRMMSGDPVRAVSRPGAPAEYVEAIREQLGLHKPLPVQYIDYIWGLMRGDFGTSMIFRRRPVLQEIMDHFPATLELTYPP